MATEAMTREQKKAAIDLAWATYRAQSQAIPRTLPFSGYKRGGVHYEGFLEIDERLWRRYVADERAILSTPETRAA
jgi:hypothetical protein